MTSTVEKILRAATDLFESQGAAAVTMLRLADAADLAPMAISRHFPNREALLSRISEASLGELRKTWAALPARHDVVRHLMDFQESYLDYALRHPQMFDYLFSQPRHAAERFPRVLREKRSPPLRQVSEVINEGMLRGALRQDDPQEVAMTLWAHAHGIIALYRTRQLSYDEPQFREFYRRSMTRLLESIRACRGRPATAGSRS